jgi:hypothetical protein
LIENGREKRERERERERERYVSVRECYERRKRLGDVRGEKRESVSIFLGL